MQLDKRVAATVEPAVAGFSGLGHNPHARGKDLEPGQTLLWCRDELQSVDCVACFGLLGWHNAHAV